MNVLAVALIALVGCGVLAWAAVRQSPSNEVPTITRPDLDRDFTRSEQDRERRFRRRVRPWGLLALLADVAVPTVLAASGAVTALADTVPGPWWWQTAITVGAILVSVRLITLPGAIVVRRASLCVGLAAGTWRRWARDLGVAFGLSWVLGAVGLCGIVGAIRLWPTWWWLPVAVGVALLVVAASFLMPVLIEPLFTHVEPMADGVLRTELLGLAARDEVYVGEVLVADASRRTTALNAYVSGLGASRRIVVYDTLLQTGRDNEVKAVVAHELGHVVAHDVRTGTVLDGAGAAIAAAAAFVLLSCAPILAVARVGSPSDPAVVGVLIAAMAWAAAISAPARSALSRGMECRADQHCLDLTGEPGTVVAMHRSLAITNLAPLLPPRLLHLWLGTHPTSPQRIAAARQWAVMHGVELPAGLMADEA